MSIYDIMRNLIVEPHKPEKPHILAKDVVPRPMSVVYDGQGKHLDLHDFELEAILDFILQDESGQYLKMMKDVVTLAKLSIDNSKFQSYYSNLKMEKEYHQDQYDRELEQYHEDLKAGSLEENKTRLLKEVDCLRSEQDMISHNFSRSSLALLLYQITNDVSGDLDPIYDTKRIIPEIDWDMAIEKINLASKEDLRRMANRFLEWRERCSM